MRITRAGEYAVRAILYAASMRPGTVVGRIEIAKAMDIPPQFLAKIARQLSRAGLVEIVQGAKGGIRLRRKPEELTLLDVIEAVEGEIFLNDCIMNPSSCRRSPACTVNAVWNRTRNLMRECLREATFKRLLEEGMCSPQSNDAASKDQAGFRTVCEDINPTL
jgi:Rrf2 family protein